MTDFSFVKTPSTLISSRNYLVTIAIAFVLALSQITYAQGPNINFDLKAQKTSSALLILAEQSKVQIMFEPTLTASLNSPIISGEMTIELALNKILAGTNLTFRKASEKVYILQVRPAKDADDTSNNQDVDEPNDAINEDQSSTVSDLAVEEILVTAQKRSENMQRTSISMKAFTSDHLRSSVIEDVYDIGLYTPGVIVNKEIVGKVYIRGIGTENLTIGGDPGVAVHVDGAYVARTSAANFDLFDVERVEVLRGPQGTLYGRNATGGSINIISNAPSEEFYARVEAQFGNYNRRRFVGTINGALSENIFARASFVKSDRDGFTENLFTNQDLDTEDVTMGRLGLKILASEQVTIDITADFSTDNSSPAPFKQLEFSQLFEGLNGAFDPEGLRRVSQDSPVLEMQDQYGLTGKITVDMGDLELTSISAYRNIDFFAAFDGDAVDILFQNFADDSQSEQFTQELQLSYDNDGPLSWIFGLYYFNDSGEQEIFIPIPGFGFDILHNSTIQTDAYAVFGQATYAFTDKLSFTAGLRYSDESKDATQFSDFGFIPPIQQDLSQDANALTPRFALEYFQSNDTMLYLSATRGFKSGGFTFNGFQSHFDPEFVWAYEGGIKSRFAEGRVVANLSAFYYDYTDLQVSKLENNAGVITNAADATIWGGEIELVAKASKNLDINVGLSFLNAEFDTFLTEDPSNPQLGTIDLAGNKLTRSPEFTANVSGKYTHEIIDWGTATLQIDYQHQSKSFFTPFNRDLSAQEAFNIVNARLAIQQFDANWQLAFFVKNLFDETYFLNILESGVEAGKPEGFIAPPRTWGFQIAYEF